MAIADLGFPVEPPIEGADPSIRHREVVKVPFAIRLTRTKDGVVYGMDGKSLKDVALDVGHRMILGYRIVWTVRRRGRDPEWISEELGGGGLGFDGSSSTSGWSGSTAGGVTFVAAFEVFETDIPPQHMWSPTGGQYRVLWRLTCSARLD